ncbi:MAG: RidA family protein [Clostridiales bacterium]|nr:RidA family protein [Clostridiales bacterium]
MIIENKLKELGIELQSASTPLANYVPFVQVGDLIFISGQGLVKDGKATSKGKVGRDLDKIDAYNAAREIGIVLISLLKAAVSDLDKVERIVCLQGFVNSTADFTDHPFVINGASDLFAEVFGDKGKHSRFAVGASSLPLDMSVEIGMIAQVHS